MTIMSKGFAEFQQHEIIDLREGYHELLSEICDCAKKN